MTMGGAYTPPMTRDFSVSMDPKPFRIAPDDFEAPPILAPMALKKLARLHSELGDLGDVGSDIDRTMNLVGSMFDILLPGSSGTLFRARLFSEGRAADPDADPPRLEADPPPIDLMRQVLPLLYWLLEEYGMRPTGPSSPLLNGSTDGQTDTPNGGTSSTAGASQEVSTTSS